MTLKDSVQTAILVVATFSLLIFGASYYFVLIDPDSSNYPLKEALSITASFFGGFATLTAAYIASRLFNDWRLEKDHDTKAIYLNNAIQKLSEIHSNLIASRNNANNLMKIKNNLILKTDYINQLSISHKKTLILLHADLVVVSKLFDKQELIDSYFIYDKFINVFDSFNGLLLKKYETYFYYYINTYSPSYKNQHINVFKPVQTTNNTDGSHLINQNKVSEFFDCILGRKMGDKTDTCTYLNHIEECLNAHENIIDSCIMELKAKQQYEKNLT
ncbi:hypothetical protein [Acinetobacter guillouiae]|uniref:Uncharacterized protein n=1 Tax=Acinetobacter guillouiae NIPH 991 TaxID=1217656 RepID=N8YAU6_ACIGI|nr:hypothetical protein [Acinetobacter guillouiae]ENV16440.1 hypothetical protein F964_03375 [Acinetobacter guillouiae NIPH 991]